jgi:hypothetical protein
VVGLHAQQVRTLILGPPGSPVMLGLRRQNGKLFYVRVQVCFSKAMFENLRLCNGAFFFRTPADSTLQTYRKDICAYLGTDAYIACRFLHSAFKLAIET